MEESLVACSKAHRPHVSDTLLKNASVVATHFIAQGCEKDCADLWFMTKECANCPILTQEVVTGDNETGRPRDAVGISKQLQLFYVYEMVGTRGATSRGNSSATTQFEVVARKKTLNLIFAVVRI